MIYDIKYHDKVFNIIMVFERTKANSWDNHRVRLPYILLRTEVLSYNLPSYNVDADTIKHNIAHLAYEEL